MSLQDCYLFEIQTVADQRGLLSVIEFGALPFQPARIYSLSCIPSAAIRGEHAHRELSQILFMPSGSLSITLEDGTSSITYQLNNSSGALFIAPMTWRSITEFSSDAVLNVLASHPYDESDYIRKYDDFMRTANPAKDVST